MGKFNKTGKRGMPELNTSSLPDLIFTMLFFFMIVTTMREVTLKVQFQVPQGTELEKLEKKSLVSFIYIGKPLPEFQKKMGAESRIQLNDKFAEVSEVQDYIYQERENMKEEDQPFMTVSLKVDKDTKMGIVQDVKQALRQAYALKITIQLLNVSNSYISIDKKGSCFNSFLFYVFHSICYGRIYPLPMASNSTYNGFF